MKIVLLALALSCRLFSQATGGGMVLIGTIDFTGAVATKPAKSGTTLPLTCAVSELFYKTDASAGSNIYGCTAPNTWTVEGGGGIAGLGIIITAGPTFTLDTAYALSHATNQAGSDNLCNSASASSSVYTCLFSPTLTAYTTDMRVLWNVGSTACAGGAMTLNIDILGAKPLKQIDGSTNLSSSDCPANRRLWLVYDGTSFRFLSNSSGVAGVPSPSANGIVACTGTSCSTASARTIADSSTISWTNPDGVSGNPSAAVISSAVLTRATDQAGTDLYCAASGGPTAYTCSLTPSLTVYTDGMLIRWNVGSTACTGATTTTLDVNSIGTKSIKQIDGSTNPASTDCPANRRVLLMYDGTVFRILSGATGGGGGLTAATDIIPLRVGGCNVVGFGLFNAWVVGSGMSNTCSTTRGYPTFSNSAAPSMFAVGEMPDGYDSTGAIDAIIEFTQDSGLTGNYKFTIAIARVVDGTDITSVSYAVASDTGTVAAMTNNTIKKSVITGLNKPSGLAAGDSIQVLITRDNTIGTNMAGTVGIYNVRLRYQRH